MHVYCVTSHRFHHASRIGLPKPVVIYSENQKEVSVRVVKGKYKKENAVDKHGQSSLVASLPLVRSVISSTVTCTASASHMHVIVYICAG